MTWLPKLAQGLKLQSLHVGLMGKEWKLDLMMVSGGIPLGHQKAVLERGLVILAAFYLVFLSVHSFSR